MEAILAEGVGHVYGKGGAKVEALKGFSLKVGEGAFEALMGPSGSGKSTFLHLAAGLERCRCGSILVGGTDVAKLSDSAAARFRRRNVGVVFQNFNLIDTLTVAENIVLPARLDGAKPDVARAGELAERLGISGRLDRKAGALSGGERQRAAFARALYARPKAVLADEPTGNLDAAAAKGVCAMLREANLREGSAVLLVTHDPVVAAAADRVHFIRDGAVAATAETKGDPARVAALYLETFA